MMTEMRSDATGAYYSKHVDGMRVEITRDERHRIIFWPPTVIYDQVLEDPGAWRNCRCTDCGCCVGCGQTDADLFGAHGYACVVG